MTESWTNIPNTARVFLLVWVVLVALTLFFFWKKHKLFIWALGLSVFSLASAFALFTPFLYRWDEQFHALVGKNLSMNPFQPILIDINPAIWQSKDWSNANTWLHKQPFFLYQIALSIKLLGASVYAVRLPSVLLHVAGTLAIFDIGKMMLNRNFGLLAALLFSVSAFPLGLLSGRIGTDHNDSVFMIYVLLSFWAWFKMCNSEDKKWAKWIGIFVGCAILTKWLVGLLIFAPWGLWLAANFLKKKQVDLKSFFKALGISLLITIPWQIYIFIRFPKEAKYEMEYNGRHFFEVIEGHPGDWDFHFQNAENLFFKNWLIILLLIFSFIAFLFSKRRNSLMWSFMAFSVALVYIFFSIAATKMGSFISPVFPFIIVLMIFPVAFMLEKIKQSALKKFLYLNLFIVGLFVSLKPSEIPDNYGFVPNSENKIISDVMKAQWEFFEKNKLDDSKKLVINSDLRGHGGVSWQFVNGTKAISSIPSKKEIEDLKKSGYSIFCVQWQWGEKIPEYVLLDSSIILLQFE
jgi:4-amino-4-deoxy-L-arabinose transferase